MRRLILATTLTLAAGAAAAQTPAATAPSTSAPTSAAPAAAAASNASATASPFRAGMPVKDAQGAAIGSIARVIKTPDGATTYSVSVDGHNVNLPGSALTLAPSGTEAVSSMSKAQISASTAPPV